MKFDESIPSPAKAATEAGDQCRFTLEQGAHAGQSFTATLHLCPNPICSCGYITFECQPFLTADPPTPGTPAVPAPLRFDLEVFERVLGPRTETEPATIALARGVMAELQATDWKALETFLMAAKLSQMETMDLDALEVYFPPAVRDEGAMAGYQEIFPWAEMFEFPLGAQRWMMDDQYCVQPGCSCTQAMLAFGRLRDDGNPTDPPLRCTVFVRHDYFNGKTKVVDQHSGGPTAERLMEALCAAHPDLGQTLRRRHGQLQQLGRRLLPKPGRRSRRPSSYLAGRGWNEIEAPTLAASAPTASRSPQVGRNEPCPCGSGKKFKKCCGAA